MLRSPRSRRSAAAFYSTALAVVIGLCCMAQTCSLWLHDAPPQILPAAIGLGALLLATLAVLRDGRMPRRTGGPPPPAPPSSAAR